MSIECVAVGFPAPFINWRHNWGHVCEEPRCFSTNDGNGKGTFTITETRVEDSGAYSCEAINSKGRVFAIPDAILTVTIINMPKGIFETKI
jgi:dystroglycan 1